MLQVNPRQTERRGSGNTAESRVAQRWRLWRPAARGAIALLFCFCACFEFSMIKGRIKGRVTLKKNIKKIILQ